MSVSAAKREPLKDRLSSRIDLRIPGFEEHYRLGTAQCFTFEEGDCRAWYRQFSARVLRSVEQREFFPVYRMGDGEYAFALGYYPTDRLPWRKLSLRQMASRAYRLVTGTRGSHKSGSDEYGREQYTASEKAAINARFADCLRIIAEKGALALGLDESPLYSAFYPEIADWFDDNGIYLDETNFVHVYFVYSLLHGPDRDRLLRDRRVLVVTGLDEAKERGIEAGLRAAGVREVRFLGISKTKSMLDTLDLSGVGEVDLALVGAGVGSANILVQLEPLQTACIDVGFVLSTIADPELRWNRPFCVPDEEWDADRVRFLPQK